jgi:hypothetical protein
MTEQYTNPFLQELFDDSGQSLEDEDFIEKLMKRVDGARRRRIAGHLAFGGMIALLAWYVQEATTPVSRWMMVSLFDLGTGMMAELLAPLNTVGTLVAFGLLGLRVAYKRIRGA